MDTNPYAFLRMKAGLSQNAFCQRYTFAKQTLTCIESGMYTELSDRMVVSLGKACAAAGVAARLELLENYGVDRLQQAYVEWRQRQRGAFAETINRVVPGRWTNEKSPMDCLVEDTTGSVQGFAKALKVPNATLIRYMRGKQLLMPRSLESALRGVNYPYLPELYRLQTQWARKELQEEEI